MSPKLISEGRSLVVIGSQNDNPQDRIMSRSAIRSVQILGPNLTLREASFFSGWGTCGVSAMAVDPGSPDVVYVATGTTIMKVDCGHGGVSDLAIPDLIDVHEISIDDGTLRIANTGRDEIVSYDLDKSVISDRLSLRRFAGPRTMKTAGNEEVLDTFHCNQYFTDMNGDPFVLVHHTEGQQILKKIAQKLLKSQGTGGVINVRTGDVIPLNLKAPHSVRIWGDHYVILNSGHFLLQLYDRQWKSVAKSSTAGFGRGADIDHEIGMYYGGISATRKRYLDFSKQKGAVNNMVLFVRQPGLEIVHREEIPGIEQINNVYLISTDLSEKLLSLTERVPVTRVA